MPVPVLSVGYPDRNKRDLKCDLSVYEIRGVGPRATNSYPNLYYHESLVIVYVQYIRALKLAFFRPPPFPCIPLPPLVVTAGVRRPAPACAGAGAVLLLT